MRFPFQYKLHFFCPEQKIVECPKSNVPVVAPVNHDNNELNIK